MIRKRLSLILLALALSLILTIHGDTTRAFLRLLSGRLLSNDIIRQLGKFENVGVDGKVFRRSLPNPCSGIEVCEWTTDPVWLPTGTIGFGEIDACESRRGKPCL